MQVVFALYIIIGTIKYGENFDLSFLFHNKTKYKKNNEVSVFHTQYDQRAFLIFKLLFEDLKISFGILL